MKNGIKTFIEWLEEDYGVTWEYFDNNYSNTDEVYRAYNYYLEEHNAPEEYYYSLNDD